jgi:hypothetical protein
LVGRTLRKRKKSSDGHVLNWNPLDCRRLDNLEGEESIRKFSGKKKRSIE